MSSQHVTPADNTASGPAPCRLLPAAPLATSTNCDILTGRVYEANASAAGLPGS
jgi:hypothetical protein